MCRFRDYKNILCFVSNIDKKCDLLRDVFSLKCESSSRFTSEKSFLNLLLSIIQLYLADYLRYLSVLLLGISINSLVSDHVVQLWFSTQYFSPEKDPARCLFSIHTYYQVLKPEFIKFLTCCIWSWCFLKVIFLRALLWSIWIWFSAEFLLTPELTYI